MKYLHTVRNPDLALAIVLAVFGLVFLFNAWKLSRFRRPERSEAERSKQPGRRIPLMPILLIVLGLAEIAMGLLDIRMPAPIAFALSAVFILWGIKTLRDAGNRE